MDSTIETDNHPNDTQADEEVSEFLRLICDILLAIPISERIAVFRMFARRIEDRYEQAYRAKLTGINPQHIAVIERG